MIKIALVGCGNWASKIIKEIDLNRNYILNLLFVGKRKFLKIIFKFLRI